MKGSRILLFSTTVLMALALCSCGGRATRPPESFPDTDSVSPPKTVKAALKPPDEGVEDLFAGWNGEAVVLGWSTRPKGDVNKDNEVSGMDVFPLAAHFNHTSNHNGNTATDADDDCIDVNRDGVVNGLDLFVVAANFQEGIDEIRLYYSADGSSYSLEDTIPAQKFPALAAGECPRPYTLEATSHSLGSHWFKVRLEGGGTEGPDSNVAQVTGTEDPPETPGGVTLEPELAAIAVGWQSAWGAAGYNVYRDTVSFDELTPGRLQDGSPLSWDTLEFHDADVLPGQVYHYRVSAVNAHGESGGSDEVSGEGGGPDPPTGLTASGKSGRVDLEWNSMGGVVDGYYLYRDTAAFDELTPERLIATIDKRDDSYSDSGLDNGQPYFYRLTGYVGAWESVGSEQVSATPALSSYTWTFDTVMQGEPGTWMTLMLDAAQDSNGKPGVTFFDYMDEQGLKYGELSSGDWEVEKVDVAVPAERVNFVGFYPSLAYDSRDRPAIAYQASKIFIEDDGGFGIVHATTELRFAHKVGGWNIETVDDGMDYPGLGYPEPGKYNALLMSGDTPLIVSTFQRYASLYDSDAEWYYKPSTSWNNGSIAWGITRMTGVMSNAGHPFFFGYEIDTGLTMFEPQDIGMLGFPWYIANDDGGGASSLQYEAGLNVSAAYDPVGGQVYLTHYHEDNGLYMSLYDPFFGDIVSERLIAPGDDNGVFNDIAFSPSGTLGVCYWNSTVPPSVHFGVWDSSSHSFNWQLIEQGSAVGRECNLLWLDEQPLVIYSSLNAGTLVAALGEEE